jgi:hypothetical protein
MLCAFQQAVRRDALARGDIIKIILTLLLVVWLFVHAFLLFCFIIIDAFDLRTCSLFVSFSLSLSLSYLFCHKLLQPHTNNKKQMQRDFLRKLFANKKKIEINREWGREKERKSGE